MNKSQKYNAGREGEKKKGRRETYNVVKEFRFKKHEGNSDTSKLLFLISLQMTHYLIKIITTIMRR